MHTIRSYIFVLCASISSLVSAQTCGLSLFSENGEKFKVYTNGTLRNLTPVNEIKLCGFPSDVVKLKLEFEDSSHFEKIMYLRAGFIENHRVFKKKGNSWYIAFESGEEIPKPLLNLTVITIITNSQTVVGGNTIVNGSKTITVITNTNQCISPVSDNSFYQFYGHLKNLTFDADRLKEAKSAISHDCFTSKQVKDLLKAFSFESSRLEFAKYAYSFVYDKGVYSIVKEGFSNSLSGDELEQYIKNK